MIWLTWRQFRVPALVAVAALAALALALGLTGPNLAHLYAQTCGTGSATCTATFLTAMKANGVYPLLYFTGAAVMYLAPLIIGIFWGAPMVAREVETGTFRLAWNQSVTRVRWLAVKLALTGLAAMAFAGLASVMVTWWAGPIDKAGGFPVGISQLSRFQPEVFGARGIVPIGAAALAFTLGVTAGTLIRRILPAMAVTLGLFAVALVAMPLWVSPHLITPAQYTRPMMASLTTMQMTGSGELNDPVTNMPGAWILSDQVITKSGSVFTLPSIPACQTGTQQQCDAWLASQPLRQHVTYQPASRYWLFQWFETAIWLAISLALAALGRWRIKTLLSERAVVPRAGTLARCAGGEEAFDMRPRVAEMLGHDGPGPGLVPRGQRVVKGGVLGRHRPRPVRLVPPGAHPEKLPFRPHPRPQLEQHLVAGRLEQRYVKRLVVEGGTPHVSGLGLVQRSVQQRAERL